MGALDRPGRHVRRVHEPQFVGEVRLIGVAAGRSLSGTRSDPRGLRPPLQELLGTSTPGMACEALDAMTELPKDLNRKFVD